MVWEYCTSGAAVANAGANVNADIKVSGATLAQWYLDAHSIVNTAGRQDFSGAYGTNRDAIL